MSLEDDEIQVDEVLDELTELIVIPADSPVRSVRLAILVKPQRPVLLVLPELDASELPRSITTVRTAPKRRGRQLSPFAAKFSRS